MKIILTSIFLTVSFLQPFQNAYADPALFHGKYRGTCIEYQDKIAGDPVAKKLKIVQWGEVEFKVNGAKFTIGQTKVRKMKVLWFIRAIDVSTSNISSDGNELLIKGKAIMSIRGSTQSLTVEYADSYLMKDPTHLVHTQHIDGELYQTCEFEKKSP